MSNFISGDIANLSAYSGTLTSAQILTAYSELVDTSYQPETDAAFEQFFYGTIEKGAFSRSVSVGGIPMLTLGADDSVKDMATKKVRKSQKWENYYHARATPSSNSLLHEYAWLGSRKEVLNYLGDSGFEVATIANSWLTDSTLTRSNTVALGGTYSGYINGAGYIRQSVTIDLASYEIFTFQIYAYNTSAETITLDIKEYSGASIVGTTSSAVVSSGLGWQLFSVAHTVASSSSNKLTCTATTTAATYYDMAMLTYGSEKVFDVPTTTEGTAGIISEAIATSGYYYPLGIDAENVSYIHPWAIMTDKDNPWDMIKQLCDASLCRLIHVDSSGVLRFRSSQTSDIDVLATGQIPKAFSMTATTQPLTSNKIVVEGVLIDKQSAVSNVFSAMVALFASSSTFDGSIRAWFTQSVAAGATWPPVADYPNGVECLYNTSGTAGENEPSTVNIRGIS